MLFYLRLTFYNPSPFVFGKAGKCHDESAKVLVTEGKLLRMSMENAERKSLPPTPCAKLEAQGELHYGLQNLKFEIIS